MEGTLILAALSYAQILAADDFAAQMPANSIVQNANRRARLRRVEADYRYFIGANPAHAPAMTAYANFLYDHGRHDEAEQFWLRALQVEPTFARAHNDLATHYGHTGRVTEALQLYERAIELEPSDPMYHFNWATTCILFRVDARQLYGWSEAEIFRRSLDAFWRARDLQPQNYELATAYAESFYLVKDADWSEARAAWEFCRQVAPTDHDRQRAYLHLARVSLNAGHTDEARQWLMKVELPELETLRRALARRLPAAEEMQHRDEQDNHGQHQD